MTHFDPQLDCSTAPQSRATQSRATQSRDLDRACVDRHPAIRRLGAWEVGFIVVTILVIHWLGMQWFVTWLGDEEAFAQGQTEHTADSMVAAASAATPAKLDDGWRRTAKGWEYLPAKADTATRIRLPTNHVSPSQLWPAAAAACMLLLIVGLPDKKATTKP